MEYNPYNSRNKLLTKNDIIDILNKHGCQYKPKNINIFQNAMVHSSYVKRNEYTTPTGEKAILIDKPTDCIDLFKDSYERLEHLGDSVLGVSVSTYLSKRFPIQQEGFLTNLRKEIVCNSMLGILTIKLKLNEFYIISRHNEELCNGRNNIKKLGDILEAFIGALWIDSEYSFNIIYSFVVSLIETYIDIPKILLNDTNYKDQLQKLCQSKLKFTPTYKMLSSENGFTMAVIDSLGKILGQGISTTKKQAEQLAALDTLKRIKNS